MENARGTLRHVHTAEEWLKNAPKRGGSRRRGWSCSGSLPWCSSRPPPPRTTLPLAAQAPRSATVDHGSLCCAPWSYMVICAATLEVSHGRIWSYMVICAATLTSALDMSLREPNRPDALVAQVVGGHVHGSDGPAAAWGAATHHIYVLEVLMTRDMRHS